MSTWIASWGRVTNMLGAIILIILILALIGGIPNLGYQPYGWYPSGGIGLVVVMLIVLLLMGRL